MQGNILVGLHQSTFINKVYQHKMEIKRQTNKKKNIQSNNNTTKKQKISVIYNMVIYLVYFNFIYMPYFYAPLGAILILTSS